MATDIQLGDCIERMRELPPESVHAVVTDPPYSLAFMGKEWDSHGDGRTFQSWCVEWATEALRVLVPGGHLLAFGGTRTFHRLAAGIEDAGFDIRDCVLWLYGSGFPKSLDVARSIDKAAGVDGSWRREDHPGRPGVRDRSQNDGVRIGQTFRKSDDNPDGFRNLYVPGSDAARAWDGWGTALKPAVEPIVVARKPLAGTVAANVTEHGTGALNIAACRIDGDKGDGVWGTSNAGHDPSEVVRLNASPGREDFRSEAVEGEDGQIARWPANVLLDVDSAAQLDEQTGDLGLSYFAGGGPRVNNVYGVDDRERAPAGYGDTGGASRFFYCAKVSKSERNAGLDGFDAVKVKQLVGSDPGDDLSDRWVTEKRNVHPTVKPIDLMRWLVRLVTPPGGTVLDPFLGSGSTGCAAVLEPCVGRFVGIERDLDYLAIAEARVAFWAEHGDAALDVARARDRAAELEAAGQLGLFG